MAYILPDPHLLSGYTHQDLPWWKALAELVDNAFDANAKRVTITFSGGRLIVHDDGDGIKDLLDVAQLGKHTPRGGHGIGMHGVGAKDAWLSCSDIMEVESVCNGVKGTFRVDRNELARRRWECDDPTYEPCDLPSYTEFRFKLRSGKRPATKSAREMLSFIHTPALSNGLQIVWSTGKSQEALAPSSMPQLQEPVRSEFEIGGKSVSIDIGILPDGARLERGPFWIIYGQRIIDWSSIGAGQYSVSRVGGTIKLGAGWRLSKNKESISESTDELADAIFSRIKPVMEKAHTLAETVELDAMRAEIEALLTEAVQAANSGKRRHRRNGDNAKSPGSVAPKGTNRKVRQGKAPGKGPGFCTFPGQDGDSTGRKPGFILDYAEMGDALGKFDRGGMRVTLNTNHPFVASSLATDDRTSLLLCGAALIANYECTTDRRGSKLLKFKFEDFGGAFGSLVAGIKKRTEASDDNKTAG